MLIEKKDFVHAQDGDVVSASVHLILIKILYSVSRL